MQKAQCDKDEEQRILRQCETGTLFLFSFKDFIYFIFRERGREGEREGEKHQCVVASHVASPGDLACNPGMCPDWELNQRPFGSQPVLKGTSFLMVTRFHDPRAMGVALDRADLCYKASCRQDADNERI